MKDFDFENGLHVATLVFIIMAFVAFAASSLTKTRIQGDCKTMGQTIMNGKHYECAPALQGQSGE